MTTEAIGLLDAQSWELDDQGAAVIGNIKQKVRQVIETLLARQDELIDQVNRHIQLGHRKMNWRQFTPKHFANWQ